MKGPFSAWADTALRTTTTASGQSALPDWLATPLAMLTGRKTPTAQHSGWASESVVRKAIALYRGAGSRRGGQAAADWHFSPDGRQAIQVLPSPADSRQQQAFLDLSRRLESVTMNHPRLAPVLEAAVQQGYPYLAARIGEGFQALTKRFGLPLEPPQALRIAEQAISALEYAHYRGMIHGSFDLGDILVNERGQISLLGVGVEQLRQRLGASGMGFLSPLLPPEVETGGQPADVRTDVYAMGALLYVLLTGRVPLPGQQVQVSQALPELPAAVDAVMTKALATQPEDRYASLADLARDLRVAMRTARPPTRPPSSAPPAGGRAATTPHPARSAPPASGPGSTPDGFPEQLPMPVVDFSAFDQALEMPHFDALAAIEIPPAPEIPKIDWVELLQPVDLSQLAGEVISLPYAAVETLETDPLVAAIMAVKAAEQTQRGGQRPSRKPADVAPAAPPSARQPAAKARRVRRQ